MYRYPFAWDRSAIDWLQRRARLRAPDKATFSKPVNRIETKLRVPLATILSLFDSRTRTNVQPVVYIRAEYAQCSFSRTYASLLFSVMIPQVFFSLPS